MSGNTLRDRASRRLSVHPEVTAARITGHCTQNDLEVLALTASERQRLLSELGCESLLASLRGGSARTTTHLVPVQRRWSVRSLEPGLTPRIIQLSLTGADISAGAGSGVEGGHYGARLAPNPAAGGVRIPSSRCGSTRRDSWPSSEIVNCLTQFLRLTKTRRCTASMPKRHPMAELINHRKS